MSAPTDGGRAPPSLAYRNAVTIVIVGGVFATLALLYLLLLPGVGGAAGAFCTVGFLFVAFVGWEFLMKPGYGILHRRRDLDPIEESAEEPESPRTP